MDKIYLCTCQCVSCGVHSVARYIPEEKHQLKYTVCNDSFKIIKLLSRIKWNMLFVSMRMRIYIYTICIVCIKSIQFVSDMYFHKITLYLILLYSSIIVHHFILHNIYNILSLSHCC